MRWSMRRKMGTYFGAPFLVILTCICLWTQGMPGQAPPVYSPGDLDRLTSRIALYPDSLLALTIAASTFPDQVSNAAHWADQNRQIAPDKLADAIAHAPLPCDPAVQALLPFPDVLDMMASDTRWTNDLGVAALTQRGDLLEAIQRMRHKAAGYGYLHSNGQMLVSEGSYIEIKQANPGFVEVPKYDPSIVFSPPVWGSEPSPAIHFATAIPVAPSLRPWGWGASRIAWDTHVLIINNSPWNKNWGNRATYVHAYPGLTPAASKAQAKPQEFHTDPSDE